MPCKRLLAEIYRNGSPPVSNAIIIASIVSSVRAARRAECAVLQPDKV